MEKTGLLDIPQCKHRIFKTNCQYCLGNWEETFIGGFEYYCSMNNDLGTLNLFESLSSKSELLAVRDEEAFVDSEYQYIIKCLNGIELYSFPDLYILAERTSRRLLDIIYIQENYMGKTGFKKYLNLRLRFVERKYNNKEAINAVRE